jgi:hypothetical protein
MPQIRRRHLAVDSWDSLKHDESVNPDIYISNRKERWLGHQMIEHFTPSTERKHQALSLASIRTMRHSPVSPLPAASEVPISDV